MACGPVCKIEAVQIDEDSIGPIESDECIARGFLTPMHGPLTKPKVSFVARSHLFRGQLSVWRVGANGIQVSALVERLSNIAPDGQELATIFAAIASEIRSIPAPTEDGVRALCLRDETICDNDGGRHPAHAHIALCDDAKAIIADENSEILVQIQRDLANLFKLKSVWVGDPVVSA